MAMERFAAEVVAVIKAATDALSGRLELLEKRMASVRDGAKGETGDRGEPGAKGDTGDRGERGEPGPKGEAGIGLKGDPGDRGEKGDPGRDGKDAEPITRDLVLEFLRSDPSIVKEAVAEYIAVHPPVNGKDGAKGDPGRDGVGVVDALLSADGGLVLTFGDGRVKDVGRVKGHDGTPGTNGTDGERGADGLGWDDINFTHDEEGRLYITASRDGREKTARVPCIIDRGVYVSEKSYEVGDGASRNGSFWICKAPTQGNTPDTSAGSAFWRLAVKKGNDGKGIKGDTGDRGPKGDRGDDGRRYS
jgi:hypothetical protein